jgi:hypothetical protein
MKRLLIGLLIFLISCSPDFSKPRYRKTFQIGHGWKRKRVLVTKSQTYRDPRTKFDARYEMLRPRKINLDKW